MYHNVIEDNIIEVIRLYNNGYSLEKISKVFNTERHKVSKALLKHNIVMTRRKPTFTPESKEKRSKKSRETIKATILKYGCLGRRLLGRKQKIEHRFKNMVQKLKYYDISLEWIMQFDDIDKIIFLNRSIPRRRYKNFTTEIYKDFITKFYKDTKFNYLYNEWIKTKDRWIKPSLDHIKAKCSGGESIFDNLQFISWLENRAKVDIPQGQWENIKKNIEYYL